MVIILSSRHICTNSLHGRRHPGFEDIESMMATSLALGERGIDLMCFLKRARMSICAVGNVRGTVEI